MLDVLVRAGCFVAIIILGYVLRKINFFKEQDFTVLSKIVLRITLPAAIVTSFAGTKIEPAMLTLSLMGLGAGVVYICLAVLLNRKKSNEDKMFDVLNLSGYNIGAFVMPFAQNFLGPTGVIATSLFDVGNAFITFGGAHSIGMIIKQGGKFSAKRIVKNLFRTIAFDTYIIMLLINVAKIKLPTPVLSFAEIISNANAFLAMLMIGVGFKLSGDKEKIGKIIKMLMVRYGIGIIFAVVTFFILPFPKEVRLALMILALAPLPTSSVAYTEDLKGDVGLASAINSITIVCSIVLIVAVLLLVM